jgi:hypothetical protein
MLSLKTCSVAGGGGSYLSIQVFMLTALGPERSTIRIEDKAKISFALLETMKSSR